MNFAAACLTRGFHSRLRGVGVRKLHFKIANAAGIWFCLAGTKETTTAFHDADLIGTGLSSVQLATWDCSPKIAIRK